MSSENGLSQNTTDFRKKAIDLGHNVEELGTITKNMASGAMDRLQENATKYYGEGLKGAEKLELKLEKAIGNNPIASILIATGIGVVAGAFWNRK